MNYAAIKNCDIANGPGVRVSLFVSGCTHHCKGCFNEVAWDFDYGQPFTQQTVESILAMLEPGHVKGITLLGGEPFEPQNQPAIVDLLRQIKTRYPEKTVWAFTGYLFDRDILPGKLGDPEITREFTRGKRAYVENFPYFRIDPPHQRASGTYAWGSYRGKMRRIN